MSYFRCSGLSTGNLPVLNYHNLPKYSRINASDRKMVSKLTGAVLTSENCLMYWLLEEEKEKGVCFNTKSLNADKFTCWTFWHLS